MVYRGLFGIFIQFFISLLKKNKLETINTNIRIEYVNTDRMYYQNIILLVYLGQWMLII